MILLIFVYPTIFIFLVCLAKNSDILKGSFIANIYEYAVHMYMQPI